MDPIAAPMLVDPPAATAGYMRFLSCEMSYQPDLWHSHTCALAASKSFRKTLLICVLKTQSSYTKQYDNIAKARKITLKFLKALLG